MSVYLLTEFHVFSIILRQGVTLASSPYRKRNPLTPKPTIVRVKLTMATENIESKTLALEIDTAYVRYMVD